MSYLPATDRYEKLPYQRTGQSGLELPRISLGLWYNFGGVDAYENARAMLRRAFDLGITHFDLANNYGPPPGSAEETLGRMLRTDFSGFRDELVISSKAGWGMWPGPYGDRGSRKYLIASLDQSLRRLGLDYVDIFYHHRPDPDTPIEETMGALDQVVRQGKALYVGISSYSAEQTRVAANTLKSLGTPCLIHQPSYNLLNRWVEEDGLLDEVRRQKMGCIVFSPLAQGLLTDRYLERVPEDSRAKKSHGFLQEKDVHENRPKIEKLAAIARQREQSLAQMAVSWVLRDPVVTSALVGASRKGQIEEVVQAAHRTEFTERELARIDAAIEG